MASRIISSYNIFIQKYPCLKDDDSERSKALRKYFSNGGVVSAVKAEKGRERLKKKASKKRRAQFNKKRLEREGGKKSKSRKQESKKRIKKAKGRIEKSKIKKSKTTISSI